MKIKQVPFLVILLIVLISIALVNSYQHNFKNQLNKFLGYIQNKDEFPLSLPPNKLTVVQEESVIVDAVKKVSPSVVTVTIDAPARNIIEFSPFGGLNREIQGGEPQDIGTGFIVSADGLIVTNKHVVSDTTSKYKVTTHDEKVYEVQKIMHDPLNDLAILKIDAANLTPIEMGDSSAIEVGQLAIAIGTALGEFRNTVTVGVISGVGRGITAGSPFEGYVEQLDDVIQTDAAINPGNSGGPLLNSSGQVVGINTAVSGYGQNIGFAIPSNVIKESLDQFYKRGGEFRKRPFIGVSYKLISRDLALINEVPEGVYVQAVVQDSPADKAGLMQGDIIIKINGEKITEERDLSKIISEKNVGDQINLEVWRDEKTETLSLMLEAYPENQ